jgi:hypothetical protein
VRVVEVIPALLLALVVVGAVVMVAQAVVLVQQALQTQVVVAAGLV